MFLCSLLPLSKNARTTLQFVSSFRIFFSLASKQNYTGHDLTDARYAQSQHSIFYSSELNGSVYCDMKNAIRFSFFFSFNKEKEKKQIHVLACALNNTRTGKGFFSLIIILCALYHSRQNGGLFVLLLLLLSIVYIYQFVSVCVPLACITKNWMSAQLMH